MGFQLTGDPNRPPAPLCSHGSTQRLFQPFRSSFDRGTGLGLAIVHRVVTDYNGTIHVSSQEGTGTVVSVRLPVHTGILETAIEAGRGSVAV